MEEKEQDILIVKVGTSVLTKEDGDGRAVDLDCESFRRIGSQIVELANEGTKPIIVSSAAITAGMVLTEAKERPQKEAEIPEAQRLASIGWRYILNSWGEAMPERNIGELLITRHELNVGSERTELHKTTRTLLSHGDIPIVNENDAIAHEEITYGDNDILAATFAASIARSALFNAKVRLVLLSDVDGVYVDPDNPKEVYDSIDVVTFDLSDANRKLLGESRSKVGSGGMASKFDAARVLSTTGVDMWVANGREENGIQKALDCETGTYFPAVSFASAN